MMELIEELKNNQKINIAKGLENRIDIDYIIERLENNKNSNELFYIKNLLDEVLNKHKNKIESPKDMQNYCKLKTAYFYINEVLKDE